MSDRMCVVGHRAQRLALRLGTLIAAAVLFAPAAGVNAAATPPDPVVAYWTAERMKGALTREIVFAPGASLGSLLERGQNRATIQSPLSASTPIAAAGTVAPAATTYVSSSTGAPWNDGGLVLNATGKVFFTMGRTNYVCSGAAATDSRSNYSLVLTAAHCVYDQTTKKFATNWVFVPAYDLTPGASTCAATRYGCWQAIGLVAHSGFTNERGFTAKATTRDWGFAVVGVGGLSNTAQLDATVGSFPLAIAGFSASGDTSFSFGYPAASPYTGVDLTYCSGPIGQDANNGNRTWSLACNMTGGSSGGPWMSGFAVDRGSLSSVNSYRYSTLSNMYGPKFDSATQATYTAADGATKNTIVVGP